MAIIMLLGLKIILAGIMPMGIKLGDPKAGGSVQPAAEKFLIRQRRDNLFSQHVAGENCFSLSSTSDLSSSEAGG